MSITVFAAHKDGSFNFSGLHQDIMVYRYKTKKVEYFPTDGIWLCVDEDIEESLSPVMFACGCRLDTLFSFNGEG